MTGLIFSKAGLEYSRMAHAANVSEHDFITINALSELEDEHKSTIVWLLAEPSLALQVLPELPNLRWLQSTWAGVESLVTPAARRDYALTNIKGIFAPLMREYVLAHCLAFERHILAHHAAKLERRWLNDSNGVIRGKTMLIMGVGSIGAGIAEAARFMGMRVLGVVNNPRQIESIDEVGSFNDLPHLLPQADYVVNVLPNTPTTQNLVDAHFLSHMKPTALFINVGRGQAVVEADLATALHNGIIAAAVLDVYQVEPLPENHVFWDTPNLTLTSHTAAPSFPNEVFDIFIENYRRFKRGEALIYSVDFEKGY